MQFIVWGRQRQSQKLKERWLTDMIIFNTLDRLQKQKWQHYWTFHTQSVPAPLLLSPFLSLRTHTRLCYRAAVCCVFVVRYAYTTYVAQAFSCRLRRRSCRIFGLRFGSYCLMYVIRVAPASSYLRPYCGPGRVDHLAMPCHAREYVCECQRYFIMQCNLYEFIAKVIEKKSRAES